MFERLRRWFKPKPAVPKPPPRRVGSSDPVVNAEMIRLCDEMNADNTKQLPVFRFWLYCSEQLPTIKTGQWRFVYTSKTWLQPYFEEM